MEARRDTLNGQLHLLQVIAELHERVVRADFQGRDVEPVAHPNGVRLAAQPKVCRALILHENHVWRLLGHMREVLQARATLRSRCEGLHLRYRNYDRHSAAPSRVTKASLSTKTKASASK